MTSISDRDDVRAAAVAAVAAAFLIAEQVGAKAARDALFLSHHDVTDLPAMVAAGAASSLAAVFAGAALFARHGVIAVLPALVTLSAAGLVLLWVLADARPELAGVLLYLHVASFGAVLISGFWSALSDRFDPRTARLAIGRIAAGGALGGLVGGVLAERVGAIGSMRTLLLFLAVLHVACGLLLTRIGEPETGPGDRLRLAPALASLGRTAYLRNLSALVLTVAAAAACLDYAFKWHAVSEVGAGEPLLRFLAVFYMSVGAITFVVQAGLAQRVLARFGLAGTVATLPAGIIVGSIVSLAFPGLPALSAARGAEGTLRGSLFRSGYEPLYAPLPARKRRSCKAFIDVAFDRLGDGLGAGIVRAIVWVLPAVAVSGILVTAALLATLAVWIARRVHHGWVQTLETSLLARGEALAHVELHDPATRSVVLATLTRLDLRAPAGARADAPSSHGLDALACLAAGDATEVRAQLERETEPPPTWIPFLVALLARDDLVGPVGTALARVSGRHAGQLLDALVDPNRPARARRRIPRILVGVGEQRVADGLVAALDDPRFEIRRASGRALVRLLRYHDHLAVDREPMIEAIAREITAADDVSPRILDEPFEEEALDAPFGAAGARRRAHPALEHVFALLATFLPERPLTIAYQALLTRDRALRGTALEYLESVLPERVRQVLWPFVGVGAAPPTPVTDPATALAELLRSRASIERRLGETGADDPSAA